jgi:hypothetical protein
MCVFCTAIPVAATTGVALNSKQLQAKAVGAEKPDSKPIMPITAGVIFLLLIGSAAYHTLTSLP